MQTDAKISEAAGFVDGFDAFGDQGARQVGRKLNQVMNDQPSSAILVDVANEVHIDLEYVGRRWCNKMSSSPAAPDFLTV